MDKLVSIIVLTHNSEKYIRDCLESILKQTYKNLEIVMLDNDSKDESLEIAKEVQRNSRENLRVIINNKNFQ